MALSGLFASCGEKSVVTRSSVPAPAPAVAQEPQPAPAPEPAPPPTRLAPVVAEAPAAPAEEPAVDEFAHLSPQEAEIARRARELDLEAIPQALTLAQLDDAEIPALASDELSLLDEIAEEPIPDDYDIAQSREDRLRNTQSELPLTLNDQVVRMINFFTGKRGSKTLRATLGRSGAYRPMIERILEEEDVPPELFYLAQAESGFRPKARSYARATGMWQFMAFRGKQYGLRQDRYLEGRYDPEEATRAAARHLKDLHIEFGDWYLAMAAYNSGPGRVETAIKRGGTRDYWELSRRRLLPRQTRNYVPIILAMVYVDKNLDMYDVGTIDYAPERRYDTVEVDGEITLELIADATGSSVSELEVLNPALLRSATPPYSYSLRIPEGKTEAFRREIAAIPAEKRLSWRRHEAQQGESLASIAKKFSVSEQQLVAVNNLSADQPALELGMRLTIPTTTKLKLYRSYGSAGGLLESGTGRYRIARGDTLGGIARRFGVSVADLRQWNGLPNSRIRAGRYLIVRPEGVGAPSTAVAANGTYRVRRGDTLGSIARRFRTSIGTLQAWNGISGSRIYVGQSLKVPGMAPVAPSRTQSASAAMPSTPGAPAGPGQYRIRNGDNLGSIADRFGVSISDLKRWNNLRSSRIRAGKYLVVRPPSANPAPSQVAASGSSKGAPIRYRVRSGDNLTVIAKRNGTSVSRLKSWNNLRSNRLSVGQRLIVGYGSAPSPTAPVQSAASKPVARTAGSSGAPIPASGLYTIRRGDNLGAIAERYDIPINNLRAWNNIRGSRITAGDTLRLTPPGQRPASMSKAEATKAAPSGAATYRVRSGDTLGAIADRHGVTVAQLKSWNGLRSSRINVGQSLTLRQPTASGGQYKIRSGDTLEVIAKRFNVSVQDLKSWNGLRSSRIRAGDYLTVRPASSAVHAGGGAL